MATHSMILGWRIPWTERSLGGYSSGVARVGYDLATKPSVIKEDIIFTIYIYIYINPILIWAICFSYKSYKQAKVFH